MALIRVTSNELRNSASELRNMNSQLKTESDQFIQGANALGGTWEGETKQAFLDAAARDKQQMDAFMNLIDKYIATIEEIARKYDTAEAQNTQIATARVY